MFMYVFTISIRNPIMGDQDGVISSSRLSWKTALMTNVFMFPEFLRPILSWEIKLCYASVQIIMKDGANG